jgi:hypothetical protein
MPTSNRCLAPWQLNPQKSTYKGRSKCLRKGVAFPSPVSERRADLFIQKPVRAGLEALRTWLDKYLVAR